MNARMDRRALLGSLAAGTLGAAALGQERGFGTAMRRRLEATGYVEDPVTPTAARLRTRFAVNVEIWWSALPLLDRVRKAAEAGFPAIEFWPWRNKDLEALGALAADLGLEVAQFTTWGFKPGLNESANHEAFVSAIEEGCAAAAKLACKRMTVVAGDDVAGLSQQQMHANVIAGLKRAAPIAEAHGVTLILEPMNVRVDHKGHCLYGSPPAIAICEAVGSSHVKINWDLYHMQLSEGDLCGRLREGREHLGYVQVADTPGRREPGTGEVNFGRVFAQLRELGYDGPVGLECWPQDGEARAIERLAAADAWEA